ncbi:MAG: hypothetical protein ABIF71_00190 [Planctomycetota bacterium]
MNRKRSVNLALAAVLAVVVILAVSALARAAGLLADIGADGRPAAPVATAAVIPPPVIPGAVLPVAPAAVPAAVFDTLPGIMPREALAYLRIADYPAFHAALGTTGVDRAWETLKPGIAPPVLAQAGAAWERFLATYQFPVDRMFRGLGPAVDLVELVITDFTLFRGRYSIRLAGAARVRDNPKLVWDRVRTQSETALAARTYNGTEMLEKVAPAGTLTVFMVDRTLYIAAGPQMAEELIDTLRGTRRPAGGAFAANPGLVAVADRLDAANSGLFLFAGPRFLAELGLGTVPGPAGAAVRVENGACVERVLLPVPAAAWVGPGPAPFRIDDRDRVITTVEGALQKPALEALAAAGLRTLGSTFNPTLSKDPAGSFWDWLYALGDQTGGFWAGALKWDPSGMAPAWYFCGRIADRPGFDEWIARGSAGAAITTVVRPDGTPITIIPLKRQLVGFGAFCYFTAGDLLFCSYDSTLLRGVPGRTAAEDGSAPARFTLDPAELGGFIEAKSLKGMVPADWFDLKALGDLRETGRVLGPIDIRLAGMEGGAEFLVRSSAGLTGLPSLIRYCERQSRLIEE